MPTKTKRPTPKLRPVLITTLHRGVFFGFTAAKQGDEIVKLERCRNVLSWTAESKGFLGLAANGPKPGAKVGPSALSVEVRNVTSVTEMSAATGAAFESFPVWL